MKVLDLLEPDAKPPSWFPAAALSGYRRGDAAVAGAAGRARLFRNSDRHKGKASFRRVPLKTAEQVLKLYQEKYYDLNVRHFREKLRDEHGIDLSYTCIYSLLGGGW